MSIFERIRFVETAEQERDRLASAPAGSTTHELSKLPVTIEEYPKDLVIELPWTATEPSEHRIIVVPIEYTPDSHPEVEEAPLPRKRYAGWWSCAVVASDHPSYPVGGYRVSISGAELARGEKIDLLAAVAPF